MNIIRVKKETNYTVLDNTFIQDTTLSWKEKGLMCYLLSLPDDWKINVKDLHNRSANGRDATATIINKLIEHGYIKRTQARDGGKFGGYDYTVHELPYTGNPYTDTPDTDKPYTDNQNLPSTNVPSTDELSTNHNNNSEPPKPKKPVKHKYGEYNHVLLTDDQLSKLQLDYPNWEFMIKNLDEYIEMKGAKYKNHYLTMKTWERKNKKKEKPLSAIEKVRQQTSQEETDNFFNNGGNMIETDGEVVG